MTRYTLAAIRSALLDDGLLADEWITASELQHALGLGGNSFYRVALICERLTLEGVAEIRRADSRGKRFYRLRRPEAASE